MTVLTVQDDEAILRNDQIEDDAHTCERLTEPDASAEWARGTMDCARALRAKKTVVTPKRINTTVH